MFQRTGRVSEDKGMKFYEQDVIMDDYIYNSDSSISMTLDYLNSGFGIIILNEDSFLREKKEMYLFRLGYKEYSIEYKIDNMQQTILRSPINVAPPKTDMNFTLSKVGRKITVSSGIASFEYIMPRGFEKYRIGIYSNSNNTVKTLNIDTEIPDGWTVNMKNTNGGHIKFEDNTFIIEDCYKGNAEIIQNSIVIDKGKYKLNYISNAIEDKNDIKAYIYYEDDDRYVDEEKNILNKNNEFVIKDKTKITLKFKGKNGSIKNIYISDNPEDSYVPTVNNNQIIDGSYVKLKTSNFKIMRWSGVIHNIPNKDYCILDDGIQKINVYDLGLFTKTKYEFEYDITKNMLYIYKDNEIIKSTIINSGCKEVKIFYNIDAIIDDFYIIKDTGERINIIISKTKKKYIPGSIISPIIVADYGDIPLDLSSSYRIIKDKNNTKKYRFTNIEREYFKPSPKIKVTNKISPKLGSIKVYGILDNPKIDFEKMLSIPNKDMDIISEFSNKYDIIYEKDLKGFNIKTGDIYLYDYDKYNLIIVDYLKDDSYCINYNYKLKSYEVDISTAKQNYYILYDYYYSTDGKKEISSMNKYKMTNMLPEENNYIVLRRKDII